MRLLAILVAVIATTVATRKVYKMRLLVILVAVIATTVATSEEDVKQQFEKFKADHGKIYQTKSEEAKRLQVFTENLKKIETHNKSGRSYKLGVTKFADLTSEEFQSQYLGGYKRFPSPKSTSKKVSNITVQDLPESIDWRDKGVVTDIKDQDMCGSCWAFAATQQEKSIYSFFNISIESYAAIATGSLLELSTEQITACAPNPLQCGGSGGCGGSIEQLGYNYIQLFGQTTEEKYPYASGYYGITEDCEFDVADTPPVVGITGYDTIYNDQDATLSHLANVGPLAVAVDASDWGLYWSGVFDGCSFSANIGLNHAVQMVGYGTDSVEGDYWIVRNSWGNLYWGEEGYIRLKRESKAQCGTNSTPMDGTACVGGPGNDEQHVCGQCGVLYDNSFPLGAYAIN